MEQQHTSGKDISIEINDSVYCYNDIGIGTVPVIFIHGFPFDKSSWQPQMEFLKNTLRVISYDIRGFGKSTGAMEVVSMGLFADDLIALMDKLQIVKAIVCGLSMGGYILLNAIQRYPDRFEAIVLCDTQCQADTPEGIENRNQTISKIISGSKTTWASEFIKKCFHPETLNKNRNIVERQWDIIVTTTTSSLTETLRALAKRNEACTRLQEINIPCMIINGSDDLIISSEKAEFLKDNIRLSTLQFIENAGHLSNLDQPETFNRLLLDFLNSLNVNPSVDMTNENPSTVDRK
ncbi:MAG: alpha/beta hydrolase [Bacteroidetes bacterium]|nr:alpha/beta hydrolase [Bacteroidota bacterium]